MVLVCAYGISQADGAASARSAAANSLIGTATLDPAGDKYEPTVRFEGKITAASHRFAYRQCRVDRVIHIGLLRLSGAIADGGDTYGTTKSGHFDSIADVEYGGTTRNGDFADGQVPWSGGNATIILSTGSISVAKDKLGFRSYRCKPLRLTLQVSVPPIPGYPETP